MKKNQTMTKGESLARAVAAALTSWCLSQGALAQVIDHVDVQRVGDEAEIVIHFLTQIQYQRHTPPTRGETLDLYLQLLGYNGTSTTVTREVVTAPPNDSVGNVTIAYPEPNSAMSVRFPGVTSYRVRQGADSRSIVILVPAKHLAAVTPGPAAPAVAPAVPPAVVPKAEVKPQPPTVSTGEVEAKAKDLLTQAQGAMGRNDAKAAIDALNQLLNLPPNSVSPAAQALIGDARVKNAEPDKARAEYDLYLKLYPTGAEAPHVREQLAQLPTAPLAAQPPTVVPPKKITDTGWNVTGGFSQYRYHGTSSTTTEQLRVVAAGSASVQGGTITNQNAAALQANPNSTVTRTIQNTLVTNLDFTDRRRVDTTDYKFVLRDVETTYFQRDSQTPPLQANRERLNAAYYEQSSRDRYIFGIGRQTGTGQGILGRYDGVSGGINLNPQWRVNGVGGQVVEFGSPYAKQVYGVSMDYAPTEIGRVGGDAFFATQRFQGQADREAVGVEARYFDAKKNFFGLLDYDVAFKALNIAMLQANFQGTGGTNYYMSLDHRRSPVLLLTSALDGNPGLTLSDLLARSNQGNGANIEQIREDIKRMTPISNMFATGFTHPYSERWQLGADYRVSNLSGARTTQTIVNSLDPTGLQPYRTGFVASGNTHVFSVQGIGNNQLFKNDLFVVNGAYYYAKHTTAPYTAESLTLNHVAQPNEKWRFDTSLRLYWQSSDAIGTTGASKQTRIGPELKMLYRLRNNLSFELDGSWERDKTNAESTATTAGNVTTGIVRYYYAGYRWDWF